MVKLLRRFSTTLLALVLALSAWAPALAADEAASPVLVQILAINDFHGQLDEGRMISGRPVGSAPVLAAYLQERIAENPAGTLLVHVGDMVGASPPISALLQDEPTIEFLNVMGFAVGTVGNHEFDEGLEEMLRLIHGGRHEATGYFPGAAFPYTVANVVDAATGDPILPPYVIKVVNGVRVGFIGVVTTETPSIVVPSAVAGLQFLDEAEAVNRWVPELRRQGVEAIVVLAHMGGFQSQDGTIEGPIVDLAQRVDDAVDVILAGHTHSFLNSRINGKLVVQAYCCGTAFSDVDLVIDPQTGDVVFSVASVVTTWADQIEPDPAIQRLVAQYQERVADRVARVVAEAPEPITRTASPAGESALGNLIADAQRWGLGTEMAFMNPGGIRADLDAGPVTWGELYAIQPFNNPMVKLELTGEQIRRLLNQQWQSESDGSIRTRFLQISGLSYTWDDRRPVGDKVVEVRDEAGRPLDPDRRYTVAVNGFLAEGGDNFTVFTEGTNREAGPIDLDVLVAYLEQLDGPVTAAVEGRIQRVDG